MRFSSLRAALLATVALAGCASDSDKPEGHWTPGKGDGVFELTEAGPAPRGEELAVELHSSVPAYRVESYGNMKLSIDLTGKGGADAYMFVEGPLTKDGDGTPVGTGTQVADDDDSGGGHNAHLDVTLEKPGVYRIVTGTFESLGLGEVPTGSLVFKVNCKANCERTAIDQKTFVAQLQAQNGPAFAAMAHDQINKLIPDATAATALNAQLDAILADPQHAGLERFPMISLDQLPLIRPVLGAIPAKAPAPDKVISGELSALLGNCNAPRTPPANIDARLPGIGYGHFPSRELSPCQFSHADKLAEVLTSLAADNGSTVTYRGNTVHSPADLMNALLTTGHTIRVRNEHMYANFLSATIGDNADLRWPVWLDTGLKLSSGDNLVVPMGHSGWSWIISGPVVNTKVMFYLGTDGAGFFGQASQRPGWTGMTASYDTVVTQGSAGAHDLMQTLDAAATYLRRTRIERTTIAAGMPVDGYGYVGVCNDSDAVIERFTLGSIHAFPLMRAANLDTDAPALHDGLDDLIRDLPNDGDGIPDTRDALRRAVAMQPDGLPAWDTALSTQITTARHDVQ
ncbi:MAG TPA: hypothetical protein VGM90_40930 [Kofleriaceae bacterium]